MCSVGSLSGGSFPLLEACRGVERGNSGVGVVLAVKQGWGGVVQIAVVAGESRLWSRVVSVN